VQQNEEKGGCQNEILSQLGERKKWVVSESSQRAMGENNVRMVIEMERGSEMNIHNVKKGKFNGNHNSKGRGRSYLS